ncbi:MAG: FIST N-terminal domain-containing protein [Acidimicrobiia bacterium]
MRCASALSAHPVPAHAVGEVVGDIFERIDGRIDLAILFASAPHTGALEDIAGAVDDLLQPGALIGATTSSVIGGAQEVEAGPALSLWVASFADPTCIRAMALQANQTGSIASVEGWDGTEAVGGQPSVMVLLADPFSFPAEAMFSEIERSRHQVGVIGGYASAALGPGGNRLLFGRDVRDRGAVAVTIGGDEVPRLAVSQACRPVGTPFTVTHAERNMVYELAGRPAYERLSALIDELSPEDRALAVRGSLHCGIVIDDRKLDFAPGDFIVRGVLGVDRSNGALAIGGDVPVGAAVQFQVRDADSAEGDLYRALGTDRADGALVFSCTARGTQLFDEPHRDASTIADVTGARAIAGMACAGEFGAVGGRNFVHTQTASVALFGS